MLADRKNQITTSAFNTFCVFLNAAHAAVIFTLRPLYNHRPSWPSQFCLGCLLGLDRYRWIGAPRSVLATNGYLGLLAETNHSSGSTAAILDQTSMQGDCAKPFLSIGQAGWRLVTSTPCNSALSLPAS